MSSKVIVVLYPGCIFFEIALAAELLAEKYEILYTTPDGTYHHASNGSLIRAETSYKQIELDDCAAILIPGGDPGSIQDNEDIDKILQMAAKENIILAAICAGPFVLAKAGLLKGKRIAHGYKKKQLDFLKSYFEGVELTNEKFVCDGNILTAKPDAHIDFAVEIACRLDVVDAAKANKKKDYYRGIQGQKIRTLALGLISNSKGSICTTRVTTK